MYLSKVLYTSYVVILLFSLQTNATISSPKIKYLSYVPYWGLSNQIQELNVASNWAKFLKRTLVLPKYAQSRRMSSEKEPEYNQCHDKHDNCELFQNLININKLQQYIKVIHEEDYINNNNYTDDTYNISFNIDFSSKINRTTYLIRWMEDQDRKILHSYTNTLSQSSNELEGKSDWCQQGVKLGSFRCQRSAQELVNENAARIHFPAFTTFTVGRIWAPTTQRRNELNKMSNHFIGPSINVINIANLVKRTMMIGGQPIRYNAVHIRLGDFLTESWAKTQVKTNTERAKALYKDLDEKNLPLYISVDAPEIEINNIIEVYKKEGFQNAFAWPTDKGKSRDKVEESINLSKVFKASKLTRSMAEQTVCIGAQQFDSQPGSTFSGYIDLVRSSTNMMKLHGYNLEL
jgi:hypothetical protein